MRSIMKANRTVLNIRLNVQWICLHGRQSRGWRPNYPYRVPRSVPSHSAHGATAGWIVECARSQRTKHVGEGVVFSGHAGNISMNAGTHAGRPSRVTPVPFSPCRLGSPGHVEGAVHDRIQHRVGHSYKKRNQIRKIILLRSYYFLERVYGV